MRYPIVLLFFAALISGCGGSQPVKLQPVANQAGAASLTFEIQDKSFDEIWRTMVLVAGRSLTIVDDNPEKGILRVQRGVVMDAWGEEAVFYVHPKTQDSAMYTVDVQRLANPKGQLASQDWIDSMIYKVKVELGQ